MAATHLANFSDCRLSVTQQLVSFRRRFTTCPEKVTHTMAHPLLANFMIIQLDVPQQTYKQSCPAEIDIVTQQKCCQQLTWPASRSINFILHSRHTTGHVQQWSISRRAKYCQPLTWPPSRSFNLILHSRHTNRPCPADIDLLTSHEGHQQLIWSTSQST